MFLEMSYRESGSQEVQLELLAFRLIQIKRRLRHPKDGQSAVG
jgi:hypothetical protein